MSNPRTPSATVGGGASASAAARKTFFEQQRELLLGEIAMSFEQVLANINKLNRSLEAVVTVGNEFSAVEALWSQFESVMAQEPEPPAAGDEGAEPSDRAQQHGAAGDEEHDAHEDNEDDDEEAAASQDLES